MSTIDLSKTIGSDTNAPTQGQVDILRSVLGIAADILTQNAANAAAIYELNQHIEGSVVGAHRADQISTADLTDLESNTVNNVAEALIPLYAHINNTAEVSHEAPSIRVDRLGADAALRALTTATNLETVITVLANVIVGLQSDLVNHATGATTSHLASTIKIDNDYTAFDEDNVADVLHALNTTVIRTNNIITSQETANAAALQLASDALDQVVSDNLALDTALNALVVSSLDDRDQEINDAILESETYEAQWDNLSAQYLELIDQRAAFEVYMDEMLDFYQTAASYDYGTKLGYFRGYNRIVSCDQDTLFVINPDETTYSSIEQLQNALRAFDYISPDVTLTIQFNRPLATPVDDMATLVVGDSNLTDYLPSGPGKVVITGETIASTGDTGVTIQGMDLSFTGRKHAAVEFAYLNFDTCTFTLKQDSNISFIAPCNFSNCTSAFKIWEGSQVTFRPSALGFTFTDCSNIFAGAINAAASIIQPSANVYNPTSTATTIRMTLLGDSTLLNTAENATYGNTLSFFSHYSIDVSGATDPAQLPTANSHYFYLASLV